MLIEKPRLPLKEMVLHGWMPSAVKTFLYRRKGYRIGSGVKLSFGSVVCGDEVQIGAGTRMGFLSFVRGKTIRIGAHVQIGATTMIDTPHVEIGEGTRINEQVFVGGLQFPNSRLVIGRNCQIMQMTFINPTRSITIGDDTGIGGHSLLFGHTSWLSQFEGYPVDFDSIEIGNSVSIAWRVFLLPGTRIGDGAVIGANSLVRGTIPPRCLAVGYPARVVSSAPEFPREIGEAEKTRMLDAIVAEMAAFFEASGLTWRAVGSEYEITDPRRRGWRAHSKVWRLGVRSDSLSSSDSRRSAAGDLDVFLSLRVITADLRMALSARNVMWIDVESKERSDSGNDLGEEVVLYLRRYGVRFFRTSGPPRTPSNHQCAAS